MRRHAPFVLPVLLLLATPTALAQPAPGEITETASEANALDDVEVGEVEVDFEEEVTFAEEIDRGALDSTPMMPEYDERPWLVALPMLCVLVVAWNVRWKPGKRRHDRSRKKA